MKKCDFCTKSSPGGKCGWYIPAFREMDCEKAIARMVKALGQENRKKRGSQEGGTDEAEE